jgi:hypothetical protein
LKTSVKFSLKQTKETLDGLLQQVQRVLKSTTRAIPEARVAHKSGNRKTALGVLEKTMVVCRSQSQASQVKKYFEATGVNVALSTSRFDADSKDIDRFKTDSKCMVLVVVNRGTLGFNMPELVNIVDMSGSLNTDVLFQMFARLVRRHPSEKQKLFIKVIPDTMAEYVYVLMSFVIALSHKRIYDSYGGDSTKTRIPVPDVYLNRVQNAGIREGALRRPRLLKSDELPPLPRIEVMKSLFHESGQLLSSYAYTTLEEVKNRFATPFLSFKDARAFARNLGLKNAKDWRTAERPDNIPNCPEKVYRGEWVSWGDWLGTGNTTNWNRKYSPFEKARTYVRSQHFRNMKEWSTWCKTKRPNNIPSCPSTVYKSRWVSWGDWLGTGRTHTKDFLPFYEARAYVRTIGLKGYEDWSEWSKAKRPDNIPSAPSVVYRDQWVSFGDWLGTGRVCTSAKQFLPFNKARAYVRSIGLKKQTEWGQWSKAERPDNIPSNPQKIYEDQWVRWSDWMGTA